MSEEFGLKLAFVDLLPMLFFLGSMIVLVTIFPSTLFVIGTTCNLIAGFSKVLWKFLLALKRGDVKFISDLFVPFQCIGFVLMITSFIVDRRMIQLDGMWIAITSVPSIFFFIIGIIGLITMIIMSIHFDQSLKAHWKAQWVNTVAQGCFFVGLLLG
ncbi:hypothetical protein lbkm_2172 [Lachnospiraceae bacterium KM106-2]|nr:hypothetical protein lbkm_2172 [Lachnospiraceae bacterium KM106-2]